MFFTDKLLLLILTGIVTGSKTPVNSTTFVCPTIQSNITRGCVNVTCKKILFNGCKVELVPKIMTNIPAALERLVKLQNGNSNTEHRICRVPDCFNNPCDNDGQCVEQDVNYTCNCLRGFSGHHCESDDENPVITGCPGNHSLVTDIGSPTALVTWTPPTATDNSGSQTLTSDFQSGDYFPIGSSTVTYTSTDSAGNTATCTFYADVRDNENPVISGCPNNQIVVTDIDSVTALVTWAPPSATDNSGNQTLTSDFQSGDYFPIGSNTVTYTSTDPAGNMATCTFYADVKGCNSPWLKDSGSCYYFSPTNLNHNNAISYCGNQGAHLVFIGSSQEQIFLEQNAVEGYRYWIGLRGASLEEATWFDGSGLTYDNFGSGSLGGNCFRIGNGYEWWNAYCTDKNSFICEMP